MSLFSENEIVVSNDDIVTLVGSNFDEQVVAVDQIYGGANSKVFVVTTKGDVRYVAKKYRDRHRLATELAGLSFLWDRGIRSIPRPLCHDLNKNIGAYEYIHGRKFQPGEISAHHLESVADFIGELHALRQEPGAAGQPLASEACLSLQSYVDVVNNRLDRLLLVPGEDDPVKLLRLYLEQDFKPFFRRAKAFFSERIVSLGLDPDVQIPEGRRILSPSDFGFHNVIITDDDHLVFIDFEYFGWDDPAKLIADFYLQPAVPIPSELREYFLEKVDFLVANDPELEKRLPFAYLFSALKWCLLLLNCFLYNDVQRRTCEETKRREQLELSKKWLQSLEEEVAGNFFPLDLP